MTMVRWTGAVVAAIAVGLVLTACAPPPSAPTVAPSATGSSTPSPTAEVAVPSALIVSLDGLTVVDDEGQSLQSVALNDPDGVIDFLTELLGAAPDVDDSALEHKGLLSSSWPGVRCTTTSGSASLRIESAELGGLPVRTGTGIQVGSSRDAVLALDHVDSEYDGDGDGASDLVGIEPRTVPGTNSLRHPGQEGTDYIAVIFSGDTVAALSFPGGDWRDI